MLIGLGIKIVNYIFILKNNILLFLCIIILYMPQNSLKNKANLYKMNYIKKGLDNKLYIVKKKI